MHEVFADWYAKADREPTAERLQLRSDGVEAFNKTAPLGHFLDLLRFLRQTEHNSTSIEAFRHTFKTKDRTFLLRDNDLELRVLATISLILAIENDTQLSVAASLAVQAVSLQGTKELGPLGTDLIETALRYLTTQGRRLRTQPAVLKHPTWNVPAHHVPELAFSSPDQGDDWWQQNVEALSTHLGTLHTAMQQLAAPFAEIVKTQESLVEASRFTAVLGEECSMLWWLFGEHSRDLEIPFTSLPADSLSLFFGKDLADLTCIIPGPQSVPALMHKAFTQADVDPAQPIQLTTLVDQAPWKWRSTWGKEPDIGALRGIGHCLPAIAASIEVGEGGDWQELVNRRDGVNPGDRLARLDWARLCHCECLLLRECENLNDDE